MSNQASSDHSAEQATIARETIKRMAVERIAPTPDNYRRIYHEIAGTRETPTLEEALLRALRKTPSETAEALKWVAAWERLIAERDWKKLPELLIADIRSKAAQSREWPETIRDLLRAWTANHIGLAQQRKREALERVLINFGDDKSLAEKLRTMARGWNEYTFTDAAAANNGNTEPPAPSSIEPAVAVATDNSQAQLLRLFALLIDNVCALVSEEESLRGQIEVLQTILSDPTDAQMMMAAECSLKEIIARQAILKQSQDESKQQFKHMIGVLIEQLAQLSDATSDYHIRVEQYGETLSHLEDVGQINDLVAELMQDTREMQLSIQQSQLALVEQHEKALAAEAKIRQLERELGDLSAKARIDQLTGVLNRRGLDEAFLREIGRAQRGETTLSVVMLDIDNFKRLNDTHGHDAGDVALQHLADTIQSEIRPIDVLARFGGEEFVMLLPDTVPDEAANLVRRLQRQLTRKFFLHNNERILITFSAGVTAFRTDDRQETVLHRADRAMYQAKKAGKNRVISADEAT